MNFLTIFLELTPMHVMLVLGIALLLFGGKKIPELMKGLGSGVKEFKKAAQQDDQPADTKKEEETKE
jgi:sec-independent protein translocase protein TatA